MLLLFAVEGLPLYFLLASWNVLVAWICTIGTVYTALWLIADYRATVLRPILVDDECVRIRAGLRWSMDVPREQIVGVERGNPVSSEESLNLTFLGTPTHWVVLSQPVLAHGLYGLRRQVRAIGIEPDEAGEFDRAIGSRRS